MIHENVPQYIREAAAIGGMCDVERITIRNNTISSIIVVSIDAKLALNIFSKPQSKRRGIYSRIRPITNDVVSKAAILADNLSDEAIRLEFEKRFPKVEKKPKPEKAKKAAKVENTGSVLSDPSLNESE